VDKDSALLRVADAAAYLALSRSKTYQLAARGEIPSVRIGGAVRIPRHELDAWLSGATRRPQVA
jgi:excisionase family DNA binding protein